MTTTARQRECNRRAQRKRYSKCKVNSICCRCRKDPVQPGKIHCQPCADLHKEWRHRTRASKGLCITCGQEKAENNRTKCLACVAHAKKLRLLKEHGLTEEDFYSLLAAQKGQCAICQIKTPNDSRGYRWHVDHNHKTGQVRGLLCTNCNRGLGHLQDSIIVLKAAIKYLEDSPFPS